MRAAYVTSWLSRTGGGVSAAVEALSRAVHGPAVEVSVHGLRDEAWASDEAGWRGAPVVAHPVIGPASLGVAPGLRRALVSLAPDIVHVHGIWMHPSADVAAWSRGIRPYLVSPHGMLDPWAVANSRGKKRIAQWLYEDRHLSGAKCIHALCDAEARAIRAFGLTNPICVIPNGVEMPAAGDDPPPPWPAIERGTPVLLFLGRLHPKKNIAGLLRAFASLARRRALGDWHLVVAGWDQGGHAGELARLSDELSLGTRVTFLGPVHGERKDAALRNASAFVLPSLSEGLPMAVLEAWSYALPVAMTGSCNLPEGFSTGAAVEIATEPDAMARQLEAFLSTPSAELAAMGERGSTLARTRFSWQRVAQDFTDVYRWMLDGSDASVRPNTIRRTQSERLSR